MQVFLDAIYKEQALIPLVPVTVDISSLSPEASQRPPHRALAKIESTSHVTADKFLASLDYDADVPLNDVRNCLRSRPCSGGHAILQIASLGHLCVFGCPPDQRQLLSVTRRSPMSFLCAKLMDSLQAAEPITTVHFFWGEHIDAYEDYDSSASGMMNSLIAQLLLKFGALDLSIIHNLENFQNNNVTSLCRIFTKLVDQLPMNTVLFRIIDAISYYEDDDRCQEASEVIRRLARLTVRSTRCVFKLLMTIPLKSRYVREHVSKENTPLAPGYLSGHGASRH
ncbi:MAG: hypothetical protein M1830_003818 [Pleopsidium flavum]|nr:MAG: hypothetical protein M1830_003818 [Pleopsidium flavum]